MTGRKGFSSPAADREEAHMEAMAVLWEAIERDRIEVADLRRALESLHLGMASAGPAVRGRHHFETAAATLVTLIRDDRTENIRHRAAIHALQEAVS